MRADGVIHLFATSVSDAEERRKRRALCVAAHACARERASKRTFPPFHKRDQAPFPLRAGVRLEVDAPVVAAVRSICAY